jgi:hypothetical protein
LFVLVHAHVTPFSKFRNPAFFPHVVYWFNMTFTINSVYFPEHHTLLVFLIVHERRKGLVKYYSDYLRVGFIMYEYVGIVSVFAS